MSTNNAAVTAAVAALGMVDLGDDFLTPGRGRSGQKLRPSVGYQIVGRPTTNLPMQAKVIVLLINRNTNKEKPALSEPELNEILTKAHERGELQTDQSPWRIFQYYRSRLIDEAKCLKAVGMAAR